MIVKAKPVDLAKGPDVVDKGEVALEKAKEKGARELIEANKRRVEIQLLKEELENAKGDLQENNNANRVLNQTIKRQYVPTLDNPRCHIGYKCIYHSGNRYYN